MRRRTFRIAIAALVLVMLSGCTATTGGSGSRHELYSSLQHLIDDSTDVVVGSVVTRSVGSHGSAPVTFVDFDVKEVWTPDGAGSSMPAEHGLVGGTVAEGQRVVIRQMGDADHPESYRSSFFLEPGSDCLLFLTPSALPGEAAAEFVVVGVVAGIYLRQGDEFVSVIPSLPEEERGDTLPLTLDPARDL